MDLLRHLRFFVAVAENRHFGMAAAELGMTQPPLSQGIARLERHLGVRLFDRDARGVRITPVGEALLYRAVDLLAFSEELVAQAADFHAPAVARLGLIPELRERVGAVIGSVAAVAGEVLPSVAPTRALVDRVAAGELDVAIVRHPGVTDGTIAGPVLTVPTRLVMDPAPEPDAEVTVAKVMLPFAVSPRRDHPAAHDQLVDTLRRLGHSGATIQVTDFVAEQALIAARHAVALGFSGCRIAGDPLPLRLRTLYPVPPHQQPGLDYTRLAAAAGETLR